MCGRALHPPDRRRAANAGSFEDRWLRDACCAACGKILGLEPPARVSDRSEPRDWFAIAPPVLLSAALLGALAFRLVLVAIR